MSEPESKSEEEKKAWMEHFKSLFPEGHVTGREKRRELRRQREEADRKRGEDGLRSMYAFYEEFGHICPRHKTLSAMYQN